MNNYELTVILRNKDIEALKDKVRAVLQKHNVNIVKEDPWGSRKLAYMIDGEKEGYYFFMHADCDPDAVKNVIGDFRLNSDILRFLFVRMKKVKTATA